MAELLNVINDLKCSELKCSDGTVNWIASLERDVIKDRKKIEGNWNIFKINNKKDHGSMVSGVL